MAILGLVLLVLGLIFALPVLFWIGVVLLVVGLVLRYCERPTCAGSARSQAAPPSTTSCPSASTRAGPSTPPTCGLHTSHATARGATAGAGCPRHDRGDCAVGGWGVTLPRPGRGD